MMMRGWYQALLWTAFALALVAADVASAKSFALVSGRRDPRIYTIDLEAALRPANQNTANAIISRALVSPQRLDGACRRSSQYRSEPRPPHRLRDALLWSDSECGVFLQHGGRANISIMNVGKLLRPESDNTDAALEKVVDAGWFGGVGLIAFPNLLIASSSEGWLSVDGSNRISLIDPRSGAMVGQIQMALTGPGIRHSIPHVRRFPCLSWHRRRRRSPPAFLVRPPPSAAGRIRSSSRSATAAMAGATSYPATAAPKTFPLWIWPRPWRAFRSWRSPRASRYKPARSALRQARTANSSPSPPPE